MRKKETKLNIRNKINKLISDFSASKLSKDIHTHIFNLRLNTEIMQTFFLYIVNVLLYTEDRLFLKLF